VQSLRTKILIVEDDDNSREMLKILLEGQGYTIFCAGEGSEGFHMAKDEQPDLIITDLMMPGVDGFGLIRRLRQEVTTAAIPVIVFTAYADVEKPAARQLGANDIAYKPIQVDKLFAMISQWLMPH